MVKDEKVLDIIKKQIGKPVWDVLEVVDWCKYNYPRAILVSPLYKLPSGKKIIRYDILWITCPYLHKVIHDIESMRIIGRLEEIIKENKKIRELPLEDQAKFYYYVKGVLSNYCANDEIMEIRLADGIKGIGGVLNLLSIKCLHAHFAFYLVSKDTNIGKYIEKLIGKLDCEDEYCKSL